MKIAIVAGCSIPVPPVNYGGSELVIYNLVEGLHKLGHELSLYASGDSSTNAQLYYHYSQVNNQANNFLEESNHSFWAFSQISQRDYDIVIINNPIALPFVKMTQAKVVMIVHHPSNQIYHDFMSQFPEVHFVFPSKFQLDNKLSKLEKFSYIHHGIDAEKYDFSASSEDYLAYLGRFSAGKAPHLAIEAAIRSSNLIKVGGSWFFPQEMQYFQQSVQPFFKFSNVEYLGLLDFKKKIDLLKHAKALIVPSLVKETFGLVIAEAMMCGTPVIASNQGSFSELVVDGKTGFLVKADSPLEIIKAIRKIKLINRSACREYALQHYDSAEMTDKYLHLFKHLKVT